MSRGRIAGRLGLVVLAALGPAPAAALAQEGMPDPRAMSGVPLPVADAPPGSVSVRVIRGGFDQNLADVEVVFSVDGRTQAVRTNAEGRAEVSDLPRGARVRVTAVVDDERLESQEFTLGGAGVRMMLVAREAGTPAAEAVPGSVAISPDSRIIAEMQDDRLNIFYMLEVVNDGAAPVDLGGPLVFELPREARGTTVLQGSTPQATANGPRVTVTSPFPPGRTAVEIAYELPYAGALARVDQVWPAPLGQVNLLVVQIGGLTVRSPQLAEQREVVDQGQPLIIGRGPAIPAGQSFVLEIDGLPHHAVWPRNLALGLAGMIVVAGLWAAFFTGAPAPRPGGRG